MKKTLIYGAIGGVLIYLYLRSKKSKGENTSLPTKPYTTDELGQPKVNRPDGSIKVPPPKRKPLKTKPPRNLPDDLKPQNVPNDLIVNPQTKPYINPQTKPYSNPQSKPLVQIGDKPILPIDRTVPMQTLPEYGLKPSFFDQRDFYNNPARVNK